MQFLTNLLVQFFDLIHGLVKVLTTNPNYSFGFTIILFTLIIRLLLLPLNIKQTKSQAKIQELQPEIKKIQEKYKSDPQKSQAEMMKLYKEHGASPFSGCLPLLIQMPILFALFAVFNQLPIQGVKFLWLQDLSKPDKFYILPILSTVTTYLSSIMITPKGDSPQSKQTSTMNTTMALVMGFTSLTFKSALVLYWISNNLIQIGQTWIMKKIGLIGKPLSDSKEDTGVQSSKDVAKEISTDTVKSNNKKGNK